MARLWFLAPILFLAPRTDGADILAVFPIPAKSHHNVFQAVIGGLAERGHRITYITPFPMKESKNINQIVIPNCYESLNKQIGVSKDVDMVNSFKFNSAIILRELGYHITEFTFNQSSFQNLIRSDKKFDLLLLETSFCQEPFIALSHRYNAPVVEIVPSGNFIWTYWLHGNPYDPSYIVDVGMPATDRMSLFERTLNTLHVFFIKLSWSVLQIPRFQSLMDRKLRYPGWMDRPSMMKMLSNVSLILENTHYSLNAPYPLAPNFKNIAGIHIKPPNSLPKDLQKFMDEANDGVIYFTLGSHLPASTILGEQVKNAFISVFSTLKQKVLWKWETEIPEVSPNVMVSTWFPQQDLFAHKNMKLFITHGGFLSQTEAVYFGIPLIGIPIMGDQPKNVKNIVKSGYGIHMSLMNISETSLQWAINEVLGNDRYKEQILKYSSLLKDRPDQPMDTATYWIEYVLRHKGARHLRPAVTELFWYQECLLDVYLSILAPAVILIYIFIQCIKWPLRLCSNLFKKKSDQKSKNKKHQ